MVDDNIVPLPGDVIFHRGGAKERRKSGIAQAIVDKNARGTFGALPTEFFTHASIVVRNSFVVEATPSDNALEWSGVSYEGGVRFIALEDHLAAFARGGVQFSVLRSPRAGAKDAAIFDLTCPELVAIIGSGYSIKPLVDAAPDYKGLVKLMMSKRPEWQAPNTNLLTTTEIPADFQDTLKREFGYEFPFKAQEFFCSQLVAFLLTQAGLVPADLDANTTPTGLRQLLGEAGWLDVTEVAYGPAAASDFTRHSPSSVRHRHSLANVNIVADQSDAMREELSKISTLQAASLSKLCDDLREEAACLLAEEMNDDPLAKQLVVLAQLKLINSYLQLLSALIGIKGLEMDAAFAKTVASV